MSSKSPVRSCEDVDETTLSYAEVKALCAGNPLIKEKMDLDVDVTKLKVSKANFTSQQYHLEDSIRKSFPERIAKTEQRIEGYKSDLAHLKEQPIVAEGISPMKIGDKTYTDKELAGAAILEASKHIKWNDEVYIGSYKGFDMSVFSPNFSTEVQLNLKRDMTYTITLGTSELGNITRINNELDSIEKRITNAEAQLETLNEQMATAKAELGKPFPHEKALAEKLSRLAELNTLLNMDSTQSAERSDDSGEKIVADKKPSVLGSIRHIQSMQKNIKNPEKSENRQKNDNLSI